MTHVAYQASVICASPKLNSCSLQLSPLQTNAEELRAERLRRATERLRSPVVFNKDSAVRKTQLKSFSQYVESRPGKEPLSHACLAHQHMSSIPDAFLWLDGALRTCRLCRGVKMSSVALVTESSWWFTCSTKNVLLHKVTLTRMMQCVGVSPRNCIMDVLLCINLDRLEVWCHCLSEGIMWYIC